MWWHLFTTQAAGCLLLCSVIWLLPFSEWGHSLGQQSTDGTSQRTCKSARDTSVQLYLNTQGHDGWPCGVFIFLLLVGFPSHVGIDNRRIVDLTVPTIAPSPYRNILYVVIGTSPPGNVHGELHSHVAFILVTSEVTWTGTTASSHLVMAKFACISVQYTGITTLDPWIHMTNWSSLGCRRLSPVGLVAKSASHCRNTGMHSFVFQQIPSSHTLE